MDKVVHFEIPFDDASRASAFYSEVFDWKISPVPGMEYHMVHTGEVDERMMMKEKGVINGGMFQRKSDLKNVNVVINVGDLDDALERVKMAGGKIVRGRSAVGDMGFVAYFKDTEGNVVGLWETAMK